MDSDVEALRIRATALTFGQILHNQASIRPDAMAVTSPTGKLTFRELDDLGKAFARALWEQGVRPGEVIVAVSKNSIELCGLLYGAANLGATVAIANWRVLQEDFVHCVGLADAKLVCASSEYMELAKSLLDKSPSSRPVVAIGEMSATTADGSLLARSRAGAPEPPEIEVSAETPLTVIYTSGTTGSPKAAATSHRALVARAGMMAAELHLNGGDDFVAWAPMFHMVSTDFLFITHLYGGCFHTLPSFDPEAILEILQAHKIGWLILMPGSIAPFIQTLDAAPMEIRGVRAVGAMADLVPPEQRARLTKLLGAPYFNSFGCTEAGPMPSAGSLIDPGVVEHDLAKRQTAYCDALIVDAEGNPVPAGGIGELLVRGPTLFSGYLNDAEANRKAFANGWYHTGDLFRRQGNGLLQFAGRSKYLIKCGGENLYPAEIELALMKHPAVTEAAVVRRPDKNWGEVPIAFVAVDHSDVTSEVLSSFVAETLTKHKRPRAIHVLSLDSFPRNVTGKVVREALEQRADTTLASA